MTRFGRGKYPSRLLSQWVFLEFHSGDIDQLCLGWMGVIDHEDVGHGKYNGLMHPQKPSCGDIFKAPNDGKISEAL